MRNPSSSGDHIPQSSSDVFVRLTLRQTTAALSLLPKLGNIMDHGAVNDCPGLRIQTLLSRLLSCRSSRPRGMNPQTGCERSQESVIRLRSKVGESGEVESGHC
jgi:hypothetical protein